MSASTDMTAEQLLDLAVRTARTCGERQRRVAARSEEDRARLAALHAHIDKLERENARLAMVEKRASVEALSLAETKSAGADVIVADAEARRVTAEQRAVRAEADVERLTLEVEAASAFARAAEGRYQQLLDALGLIEVSNGLRILPQPEVAIARARVLVETYDEVKVVIERIQRMIDAHSIGAPL